MAAVSRLGIGGPVRAYGPFTPKVQQNTGEVGYLSEDRILGIGLTADVFYGTGASAEAFYGTGLSAEAFYGTSLSGEEMEPNG